MKRVLDVVALAVVVTVALAVLLGLVVSSVVIALWSFPRGLIFIVAVYGLIFVLTWAFSRTFSQ